MAKLSDKVKKRIMIGGLSALCVVLVVVLTVSFSGGNPNQNTAAAVNSGSSSNVSAGDIAPSSKSDVSVPPVSSSPDTAASSGQTLDVTKEQHVETGLTESSSPSSEPKKPTVSDSSSLTNSSKKPTYSKEQTHPNQSVSQPKTGDKKNGMIYVDGFGWVKDEGGGAVGETIDGDGDINKQVGQMD